MMAADSAMDHDDDLEENQAFYDAVEALEDEQAVIDRMLKHELGKRENKPMQPPYFQLI